MPSQPDNSGARAKPQATDSLVDVPTRLHEEVATILTQLTHFNARHFVKDKRVLEPASSYETLGVSDLGSSLLAWSKAALLAQIVPSYCYLLHLHDANKHTARGAKGSCINESKTDLRRFTAS
jgi:hypothetical protein